MSYFKRCQAKGVNMTPTKQRVNFKISFTAPLHWFMAKVQTSFASYPIVCTPLCMHNCMHTHNPIHCERSTLRSTYAPPTKLCHLVVEQSKGHSAGDATPYVGRVGMSVCKDLKQTNNIYAKRKGCQMSLFKYMMEINMLQVIFKIISRESKETDWTSI